MLGIASGLGVHTAQERNSIRWFHVVQGKSSHVQDTVLAGADIDGGGELGLQLLEDHAFGIVDQGFEVILVRDRHFISPRE